MMPFDRYADDHSVPPKSRRPQEVRENLPQSFHSLAVSEPDPINSIYPFNILSVFRFSNDYAIIPDWVCSGCRYCEFRQ